MKLPDLRHGQLEAEKIISCNANKAFAIWVVSLRSISKMASDDDGTVNAHNGMIILDSCSLNAGVDHDHMINNTVGSHSSVYCRILYDVPTLSTSGLSGGSSSPVEVPGGPGEVSLSLLRDPTKNAKAGVRSLWRNAPVPTDQ